tara:strand:+ start:183 stop:473 length:291 start_codon:yes stop_codon:yes gene_type:complete
MDEGISFSLNDARVKTTNRNKGRMKIQIKLSKEQAEGFSQFKNLVKPPDMTEDDFIIQLFFAGCNALANDLRDHAQKMKEAEEAADVPSSDTETAE